MISERRESRLKIEAMKRVVDFGFKALVAGLGITTVYMTVTFSVNVYRGLSWHNAQTVNLLLFLLLQLLFA